MVNTLNERTQCGHKRAEFIEFTLARFGLRFCLRLLRPRLCSFVFKPICHVTPEGKRRPKRTTVTILATR